MNAVDLLLKMDAGTVKKVPTEEVEIPRLSELAGEPFMVSYKALSGRRIMELSDGLMDSDGTVNPERAYETNLLLVGEGVTSPDLNNPSLLKHYKAPTPKDLAEIIFLGGEIARIAERIMKLSGYGKDVDSKIKN